MPSTPRHTDEDKASALAAVIVNEGNVHLTAKQLGLPDSTLRQWVDKADGEMRVELLRLREHKRNALRERFEQLAEKCLGIVEAKLEALSPRDAMICAGIATDKLRLLGEEATSISRSSTPESDARLALFRAHFGQSQAITEGLSLQTTVAVKSQAMLRAGDRDEDDTVTE